MTVLELINMSEVIKDSDRYLLIDVRNTHHEGSYQILERTKEFPEGRTVGVYFSSREAIKDYNRMVSL